MKKIFAIFNARLKEFYRDRAALGWNFMFPVFAIAALYFVFESGDTHLYKVGYDKQVVEKEWFQEVQKTTPMVKFIEYSYDEGKTKITRHKIDAFLTEQLDKPSFLINSSSPNGQFLESYFSNLKQDLHKVVIEAKQVRYIDWVIPGILAMNIMFNCLWGVGYVVVKYRQDNYLKRLNTTPVTAFHFLFGQLAARYVITFVVSLIVFLGCKWTLGFEVKGSYAALMAVYTLGVTCLISIGLLVAARTTSKEFADGILNLISWPMMMLSEVWFSIEDASPIVKGFANILPLTHLTKGARAIMVDGAGMMEIVPHLTYMLVFSVVVLTLNSFLFKWSQD